MAAEVAMSHPMRLCTKTPLAIRAIILGLAVLFAGVFPWSALAALNLTYGSSVPWAVPVMGAYLVGLFLYLHGWGWPRSTSQSRRSNLRARGLPARVWFWSLVAGGCAAIGLLALFSVSLRLGQVPAAAFDGYARLARYPPWTVVPCLVMAAIVAGAVEEAGFRGYMQAPLERRYGPAMAIAIVAVVYFLAHFAPVSALPGFVLGAAAWGLLAYLSGSIWPGVILHSLVDTASFLWAWTYADEAKALAESAARKIPLDATFYLLAGGALLFGTLAAGAYFKLARVTATESDGR
jgi:membrane protease YdiL (CAAX protease family)